MLLIKKGIIDNKLVLYLIGKEKRKIIKDIVSINNKFLEFIGRAKV